MQSLYTSVPHLPQMSFLSGSDDLIPVSEFGTSEVVAQLLQGAAPRVRRAIQRWLTELAEAPAPIHTGPDNQAYEIAVPAKTGQGKELRTWFNNARRAQGDGSELTLRSARLVPGVQMYPDESVDCIDAQAVLTVRPVGAPNPVGYATVKVSIRVPHVTKGPTGEYLVSEGFDEFHDVKAPQVEVKVVLDEVFVLPAHRGSQLGTYFAKTVEASLRNLLGSLEFLARHAPLLLDLDAEVVSFAGAVYVNRVKTLLCAALQEPANLPCSGWVQTSAGYPLEFQREELRLQVRHDFQVS